MAELFDDISRIVGSPVPRRQALRFIIHAFAGGVAATLVPSRAAAALTFRQPACNAPFFHAGSGQTTVGACSALAGAGLIAAINAACTIARPRVLASATTRCPAACPVALEVPNTWQCPNPPGTYTCIEDDTVLKVIGSANYICICPSGVVCENVCCPANTTCVNGVCTCPAARACSNGVCCSSDQICCGGTTCCASFLCSNGRCNTPSGVRPS